MSTNEPRALRASASRWWYSEVDRITTAGLPRRVTSCGVTGQGRVNDRAELVPGVLQRPHQYTHPAIFLASYGLSEQKCQTAGHVGYEEIAFEQIFPGIRTPSAMLSYSFDGGVKKGASSEFALLGGSGRVR